MITRKDSLIRRFPEKMIPVGPIFIPPLSRGGARRAGGSVRQIEPPRRSAPPLLVQGGESTPIHTRLSGITFVRNHLTIASGILLLLSIGVAHGGMDGSSQPVVLHADENCDPIATVCSAGNADMTLSLHLAGEVRPLKPFTIELSLAGRAAITVNQVTVRFAMVGMDMGENAFKVISESEHPHQAGRIRMSHLGKKGLRSNLASISRIAFLDSETPFW